MTFGNPPRRKCSKQNSVAGRTRAFCVVTGDAKLQIEPIGGNEALVSIICGKVRLEFRLDEDTMSDWAIHCGRIACDIRT